MKSNRFHYVQTAEFVNSKIAAVTGPNFVHDEEFSAIFQIMIF